MAFDFDRLEKELQDLKRTVTDQASSKTALDKAATDAAAVAAENAKKLSELQASADASQKVADTLVVKQVDFLLALIKQETNPGEDPTPNIVPPIPDPLPPPAVPA